MNRCWPTRVLEFKKHVPHKPESTNYIVKPISNEMALTVRFLAIRPDEPCGLEPAPSVTDWDDICEGLKGVDDIKSVDDLLMGSHEIRGNYRGWVMYLYPNVRFIRNDPKTTGVNGFASRPVAGLEEKAILRVNGETYAAVIEFV